MQMGLDADVYNCTFCIVQSVGHMTTLDKKYQN